MDADAISRSLTQPGGQAIPAILAEFGPSLLTPEGAMDRDAMRHLVFSNPQTKRKLEAIVHPLVAQNLQTQTQAKPAWYLMSPCWWSPVSAGVGKWTGSAWSIVKPKRKFNG
jgi:dephospho-CoA kinase